MRVTACRISFPSSGREAGDPHSCAGVSCCSQVACGMVADSGDGSVSSRRMLSGMPGLRWMALQMPTYSSCISSLVRICLSCHSSLLKRPSSAQ
nr:hypothetical protein [Phocaeicola vulgatus]